MNQSIVVLSGSPRKNGNTDKLVAAFVESARAAGKSLALFRVADMDIKGCLGCDLCAGRKGICVRRDDMPEILGAIQKATAIVLASPVYFFGVTAQLKLTIDRTYALKSAEPPSSVRRAVLLLTCGNRSIDVADSSIGMFHRMCSHLKWDSAGIIVVVGVKGKDGIAGRDELEAAKKLGRDI